MEIMKRNVVKELKLIGVSEIKDVISPSAYYNL